MSTKNFLFLFIIFFSFVSYARSEISIFEISAKKIIYENKNSLIIATGDAYAKDQFGKNISSKRIIYDKQKSKIYTEGHSLYTDKIGNKLSADNITYDIKLRIIRAKKNIKYTEKSGNIFYFTELEFNEVTEKGFGKNLKAKLINSHEIESDEAFFDNKEKTLTVGNKSKKNISTRILEIFKNKKNYYTSCNSENSNQNIKDRCPDWRMETGESIHDNKNKMIYHYDAVIKVKDIPIFYTPYLSYPDPTVKRKTGILPPFFKNFNTLGQTFGVPFFWAINDKSDATITPIYYFEENPLLLASFREQFSNGKLEIDSSFTEGYKKLDKKDDNGNLLQRSAGSKNHFFLNYTGNYQDLLFENNDLEINIQRVSQKNYLEVNSINTALVKYDIKSLNNNITLSSYEDRKKLSFGANIFENLNFIDNTDKYQYNFPVLNYNNFFSNFGQLIHLSNYTSSSNKGGDSNNILITNKIESTSDILSNSRILPGFTSIIKGSLNNINEYSRPDNNYLNKKVNLTIGVENSYPLIKNIDNNVQIITPKIFSKHTTGNMKNSSSNNKELSYNDIFSMNRTNTPDNLDTGTSIGYGVEYENLNKNKYNAIYNKTNFKIGQVLRFEENMQMPVQSTLNQTKSGFVGDLSFFQTIDSAQEIIKSNNEKNNLKINYDFLLANNVDKILKQSLNAELSINTNKIITNYYNENDNINELHYAEIKYSKKIDENYNFQMGVKKNIKESFMENNFIELNYESDCLKISFGLNNSFYQNNEIRRGSNLVLSLVLKPFGSPVAANLSSFVK